MPDKPTLRETFSASPLFDSDEREVMIKAIEEILDRIVGGAEAYSFLDDHEVDSLEKALRKLKDEDYEESFKG